LPLLAPPADELDGDELVVDPAEDPDVPDPDEPIVVPEAPEDDEVPAPGVIAGEPEVVDPDPVAVGRSDELDDVEVWAAAGAAASAVARRQAAMCVLIIKNPLLMFAALSAQPSTSREVTSFTGFLRVSKRPQRIATTLDRPA